MGGQALEMTFPRIGPNVNGPDIASSVPAGEEFAWFTA